MADQGSLADVLERAADRASIPTLVLCAVSGLVALLAVLLLGLLGRQGAWQLPGGAAAVAALAFGLGGLAHQRLRDEQAQPVLDRPRLTALRVLQAGSVLAGAAGAIVLVGRVLAAFYGSSFWN
jgi:cytochrome c-type biogenesis protein CcmH/NrfG